MSSKALELYEVLCSNNCTGEKLYNITLSLTKEEISIVVNEIVHGTTLFFVAMKNKQPIDILFYLLFLGYDINTCHNNESAFTHIVYYLDNENIIPFLFHNGYNIKNPCDEMHRNPVQYFIDITMQLKYQDQITVPFYEKVFYYCKNILDLNLMLTFWYPNQHAYKDDMISYIIKINPSLSNYENQIEEGIHYIMNRPERIVSDDE